MRNVNELRTALENYHRAVDDFIEDRLTDSRDPQLEKIKEARATLATEFESIEDFFEYVSKFFGDEREAT